MVPSCRKYGLIVRIRMLKDRIIDMLINSNFAINEKGCPCLRFGVRLIILNDVDENTSLLEVKNKFRHHIEKIASTWEKSE